MDNQKRPYFKDESLYEVDRQQYFSFEKEISKLPVYGHLFTDDNGKQMYVFREDNHNPICSYKISNEADTRFFIYDLCLDLPHEPAPRTQFVTVSYEEYIDFLKHALKRKGEKTNEHKD